MDYISKEPANEPLILEPEDWTDDEWETLCKLFGMKKAERIKVSDYVLEAWGEEKTNISDEDWKEAKENLDRWILEYAMIGPAGSFALYGILKPLNDRYEHGERTQELYDAIMECQ